MSTVTPETSEITLDVAIKRGETTITTVTLRRPLAGELRGLSLAELAQLDVVALQKLIPRISQPTLTQQEVAAMDLADMLQMGVAVGGFLLPKQQRLEALQTA